ncbi:MAG: TraR/DksA family transcriptional regulator [Planctomycetota bacterium]|jgi:RNA polymerase-binding transcription factor DksA
MGKKKQTSGLSKKQLGHYRQLLIEKMYEILGDVNAIEETLFQGSGELSSMPMHLADIGTDSYEQEFNLSLVAEERKTLLDIQQALGRIADGSFGICEGLGTPIEANRLEAIPWTRYSLEYARMIESGKAFDVKNIKIRPIDIQREDNIEDEEKIDDQDEELTADDIELDKRMRSLDEFGNEEDEDDGDDGLNRRRDSA